MTTSLPTRPEASTLIDALLEEQRDLTAVERFARWHDAPGSNRLPSHRQLVPLTAPRPGEQYAFEVDLDRCSGCKACVAACHSLNGLDENETWRSVGLLHGRGRDSFQQTITTACHHCVDPGCLNGCPVLAYDKDPTTGIVRHLDDQCIGCQYCVLMCPYEVPQFSERRGIVRKCDMCQQRLAHGESPACAQACPNEAIRITIVEKDALRTEYRSEPLQPEARANPFLPCAPAPGTTVPTTRFVSARPLSQNLIAGDSNEAKLQPAHLPLVWMLVLTQLGAGSFLLLPVIPTPARAPLALFALSATMLGLGGSVLHLGLPLKAWRAFLGVRRSWLSREIVAFGFFSMLAAATTALLCLKMGAGFVDGLMGATAVAGLLGVLCSGMTYHATRRECWLGELSVGRFYLTTLLLGAAVAWWAAATTGTDHAAFALTLVLATVVKLSRELAWLRLCPDDADLEDQLPEGWRARGAFLMRYRLGLVLRWRFACAWVGGVVLPSLSLLPGTASKVLALFGVGICITGELAERLLFFRAVVTPKMPGGVFS
jgi:Fe-S-cluster-containing dehydrogenase component/DMSO reductase anchor subunit